MKIVIRAGGVGTRLWPWSRKDRPKQFLPLFRGQSSVQIAWDRFSDSELGEADDIFVSVGKESLDLVLEQLPDLPRQQIIVEPARRDTAAAIGLETVWVTRRCGRSIIASLGSDHYVGKPQVFIDALAAAEEFIRENPEYLVTIACQPTRVEPNYGHVKMGEQLWDSDGVEVFRVAEFTEKPEYRTAKQYTDSGRYLWNANFFVWDSQTLMRCFHECEPEMYDSLIELQEALRERDSREAVRAVYPGMKKIAVDYAVLEPAAREGKMAVVPVAMEWSDIGSWATLTDALEADEEGNLFMGPVLAEETEDTTVFVDNPDRRVVAAIGVEGLAIVDTGDALLVVPKDQCGKVKRLVQRMRESEEWSDLV